MTNLDNEGFFDCIPDPIELMTARQEELIDQWNEAQWDVPQGQFRCPYCRALFDYDPIAISDAPDTAVMCYNCLPDDLKKAYDSF